MGEAPPERIGKYSVIRRIACGGMAEVYLCRLKGEEGFEKNIAVKRVLSEYSSDPRFRELFIREARTSASLSHPNLVQVFDFGKEGKTYYLAMEFIDGWNLAQVLARARTRGMSIPLPIWAHWVGGILSGIGYLHSRGIVHRDISPSNVLLSSGGLVKITDFGISLRTRHPEGTDALGGKIAYMSPEQVRGEKASTDSDLFAAAVVAAEIHLPSRLFGGVTPAETIALLKEFDGRRLEFTGLPPEVVYVLRKALSRDRNARYGDAEEFLLAVRSAVSVSVGRTEILAFWKVLFPEEAREDEDTVPMVRNPDQGGESLVREKKEIYGYGKRNRVPVGIIFVVLFLCAAGYGFWKVVALETKRPAFSPPSAKTDSSPPTGEVQVEVRSRIAATTGFPKDPVASSAVPSLALNAVFLETDPPGASVSVEAGTLLGITPKAIDMTPWIGKNIVVRKEGYQERIVRADHLAQVKIVRLELELQTGTIDVIQAIPWARVFEGNRYLGDTPIHDLNLPVGIHRLRFLNEPLGIERTHEVSVRAGVNPKVIVPLVGNPPGE